MLPGSSFKAQAPGRGNILSVFNPLDEHRGKREPKPGATGRVGPASPAAHTCRAHARAHGGRKCHTRWGWKAPSGTRPGLRLLCRRSTEEPPRFGVPRRRPPVLLL